MRKLTDDAEYAAVAAKLLQARAEHDEADREVNGLVVMRAGEPRRSKLDDAAAAYLRGEDLEEPPPPPTPKYERLCERRRVLRRAIEILAAEEMRLRHTLGREIAMEQKPAYRDAVRGIAKGLLAALAAQAKAFAILDHFHENAIPLSGELSYDIFPPIGRAGERYSVLTAWLSAQAKAGHFTKAEVLDWARPIMAETADALSDVADRQEARHAA